MFQRTAMGTFEELEYEGDQAIVPLTSVDCTLDLADVYRGVELVEEKDEDEL